MPHDSAFLYRWNVFDVTKIWPKSEYPLFEVGKLVLNRNSENYFADIE
jgi:catalase